MLNIIFQKLFHFYILIDNLQFEFLNNELRGDSRRDFFFADVDI